jgi:hypothetical protein
MNFWWYVLAVALGVVAAALAMKLAGKLLK